MARGVARARVCRLIVVPILALLLFQPIQATAAEGLEITAKYGVVVSADTGEVLFDKGMTVQAAPASLTKVFTAAVALDSAPLDTLVTVDESALVGEASMGLTAGEEVSLRTLLYGMMLPSGNDAAMAIAQGVGALPTDTPAQAAARFMERVAATNERLGLTGTHLTNPHGLDEPGHVSTARDIAAMTMYVLQNPTFRQIIGSPYYGADGYQFYQSNHLLTQYPGLIGGKTGITDEAGYCLIEVAQRDGQTIIAVVLGSTIDAWYHDAEAMLDYGFATLAARPSDPSRPTITLAPTEPVVAVSPNVAAPEDGTVPTLAVDRIADTTAVVRPAGFTPTTSGFSWRWPLASVATMGVALALIVNYPILLGIGGLALQRRSAVRPLLGGAAALAGMFVPGGSTRRHRPRRAGRTRRNTPAQTVEPTTSFGSTSSPLFNDATSPLGAWAPAWSTTPAPQPSAVWSAPVAAPSDQPWSRTATPSTWPSWPAASGEFGSAQVVRLNPAESLAARAVRLANRGQYPAATAEFASALEIDPSLDLTRCAGFWAMQPLGFVAAARAYLLLDRPTDARTLATVVQLSYGSNRELERLLQRGAATGAWR